MIIIKINYAIKIYIPVFWMGRVNFGWVKFNERVEQKLILIITHNFITFVSSAYLSKI